MTWCGAFPLFLSSYIAVVNSEEPYLSVASVLSRPNGNNNFTGKASSIIKIMIEERQACTFDRRVRAISLSLVAILVQHAHLRYVDVTVDFKHISVIPVVLDEGTLAYLKSLTAVKVGTRGAKAAQCLLPRRCHFHFDFDFS